MKLKFYFKSGNVVTVRNIESWEVGGNGSISSIHLKFQKRRFWQKKERLIVKSIDLSAIDCIVEC